MKTLYSKPARAQTAISGPRVFRQSGFCPSRLDPSGTCCPNAEVHPPHK